MHFCLSKQHPAFAGHFPGLALAPGVVILDSMIQALRERVGADVIVTGLPLAKFHQALLPETEFQVLFDDVSEEKARFTVCDKGGDLFASGHICFRVGGNASLA